MYTFVYLSTKEIRDYRVRRALWNVQEGYHLPWKASEMSVRLCNKFAAPECSGGVFEHVVSYHLISVTLISVPVRTCLLPQPWHAIHDAQLCPCLYLSASPALARCTRFQSLYFYDARRTPFLYHLISTTLSAVPVCTHLLLQPWRTTRCTRFHFFVLL